MEIALMGMGRLGRTLAPLLRSAGHAVHPWRRGDPPPRADVVWITVSDGAVAEVAASLPPGPVVLHASGALPWEVLRPHRPAGSLHPLQSFPGPEVAVPPTRGVPAAVAGDPEAVRSATQIALNLGFRPFEVPGDRRLYHAAAVVAGNFATVLLAEASRLLIAAGVAPDQAPGILAPLARASVVQGGERGPAAALTGPFARGDLSIIEGHLEAIAAAAPEVERLYRLLGTCAAALSGEGGHISTEEMQRLIRLVE